MKLARLFGVLLAACSAVPAYAQLVVFCPGAVRGTVTELAREFERATGQTVKVEFGTAGAVQKRVAAGETYDVAITTSAAIDALIAQGRMMTGSRRDLGSVGVGVAVRAGAAAPDVSTPERFRAAMLAARSVMYADPAAGGQSGIHTARVFEQLGIAEAMKAKSVLRPGAPEGLAEVARGDIEIGIGQVSEIVAAPGVVLVGPLPAPLQNTLTFSAGLSPATRDAATSRAFIDAFVAPAARARFKAAGFNVAP